MKHCLSILTIILICFLNKAEGQSEHIEQEWIKQDSVFIENLSKGYRINPINVEPLLSYKGNKGENLGFGYYLQSSSTGKGYVSIFYQFIYYKNKLISYKLDPQMPHDSRLTERYLKFYAKLFKVSKYRTPEPIYYGYDEMIEPLDNFSTPARNSNVLFFMTPYSGTMYGDYGGIASTMLDNRKNYLRIKSLITPEMCELLLYSKNPATRLSAIEYYYQNLNRFVKYKERFENRIKVIFHELPKVTTMSADEEITENAKDLVNHFVEKH
jgi:hypothetical protein